MFFMMKLPKCRGAADGGRRHDAPQDILPKKKPRRVNGGARFSFFQKR
jgi:hypothetical protein